jgi:hypothetical protein
LNEAYNEIGTLKERLDTLTSELDRRDGMLEQEKTKVMCLENIKEVN